MRGLELTVDEAASVLLEEAGQMDKGEFGGAGNEREHALAEETSTEGDAIETANEPSSTVAIPRHWPQSLDGGARYRRG